MSGLVRRQGTTGDVLRALRDERFIAIYTTETMVETIEVLWRADFRVKYHIEPGDITALVNLIRLRGELAVSTRKVKACRDPKDNKFLEAAVATPTDCIISGDADLLDLVSFEGIPVLRRAEFLATL